MTNYLKTLTAICLCVMSSALCMGQNVKIYDTSNSGLIDNDLWAVVVDHDGNKWLGTIKYGLVKFDGDTFTVFNKENSAIKGDCVTMLFVDSKGNLWAEYSRPEEGIVMYDGKVWTTFTAASMGVESIDVRDIRETPDGTIWFAFPNKAMIYNDGAWSTMKIPADNILCMDVREDGSIAVGCSTQLLIYSNGKWKKYTEKNSELQLATIRGLKFRPDGALMIGYGGGFGGGGLSVLSSNFKVWTHYNKSNSQIPDHMIRDIEYDGKNYWMASNNGLVKKDGASISAVFFREGMFANVISDIALEGKILWIATQFGLVRYEP